ncbi:DUF2510 domain-containing protein [Propionibacteriaceae bacterium Y1923]
MAEAGWYPDPGGAEGRYRYWDGESWSSETSATPGAASSPGGSGSASSSSSAASGASGADPNAPIVVKVADPLDDEPVTEASGWQRVKGPFMIIGIALVTVVALIWALAQVGILGGDDGPASNPTEFCPPVGPGNYSVDPHPNDGRVYGGGLSYPRLGSPWSPPQVDGRVPFGRDVQTQTITIEADYRPGQNWVASILVGELVDGDGFVSPRAGMDMVSRCIVGAFYGDSPVQREDVDARSIVIDGREGYLLEMHLTFDIPGLEAKGETALIAIVATAGNSNSIYYASIPDNAAQYLPVARDLLDQLRVS